MKSFIIETNQAEQRLDRFLQKAVPTLPPSLLQRAIRVKRVKVNGKRAENSRMLQPGDRIDLYLNDEFFPPDDAPELSFLAARSELSVVYEDHNLMILDKPPGLVVHSDDQGTADTLIDRVLRVLYERGEYAPTSKDGFTPALCNRIDRNTGGLVLAAKNAASLRVLNRLIKERLLEKRYLCIVPGRLSPLEGTLTSYMLKDEARRLVTVYDSPHPGAKSAVTGYRTLDVRGGWSLLEVELHTGRTHQIRAQFAHIGHPLLGDAKYGRARDGRTAASPFQALYAYRLTFPSAPALGHLSCLQNRTFEAPRVWFREEFYAGSLPCRGEPDFS